MLASLGLGLIAGVFVTPMLALAIAALYGGGIRGAQRLSWDEKAACELLGWTGGTLLAAFVAARLHRGLRPAAALAFGAVLFAFNGIYFSYTPMGTTFWATGAAASLAAALIGAALGSRRREVSGA